MWQSLAETAICGPRSSNFVGSISEEAPGDAFHLKFAAAVLFVAAGAAAAVSIAATTLLPETRVRKTRTLAAACVLAFLVQLFWRSGQRCARDVWSLLAVASEAVSTEPPNLAEPLQRDGFIAAAAVLLLLFASLAVRRRFLAWATTAAAACAIGLALMVVQFRGSHALSFFLSTAAVNLPSLLIRAQTAIVLSTARLAERGLVAVAETREAEGRTLADPWTAWLAFIFMLWLLLTLAAEWLAAMAQRPRSALLHSVLASLIILTLESGTGASPANPLLLPVALLIRPSVGTDAEKPAQEDWYWLRLCFRRLPARNALPQAGPAPINDTFSMTVRHRLRLFALPIQLVALLAGGAFAYRLAKPRNSCGALSLAESASDELEASILQPLHPDTAAVRAAHDVLAGWDADSGRQRQQAVPSVSFHVNWTALHAALGVVSDCDEVITAHAPTASATASSCSDGASGIATGSSLLTRAVWHPNVPVVASIEAGAAVALAAAQVEAEVVYTGSREWASLEQSSAPSATASSAIVSAALWRVAYVPQPRHVLARARRALLRQATAALEVDAAAGGDKGSCIAVDAASHAAAAVESWLLAVEAAVGAMSHSLLSTVIIELELLSSAADMLALPVRWWSDNGVDVDIHYQHQQFEDSPLSRELRIRLYGPTAALADEGAVALRGRPRARLLPQDAMLVPASSAAAAVLEQSGVDAWAAHQVLLLLVGALWLLSGPPQEGIVLLLLRAAHGFRSKCARRCIAVRQALVVLMGGGTVAAGVGSLRSEALHVQAQPATRTEHVPVPAQLEHGRKRWRGALHQWQDSRIVGAIVSASTVVFCAAVFCIVLMLVRGAIGEGDLFWVSLEGVVQAALQQQVLETVALAGGAAAAMMLLLLPTQRLPRQLALAHRCSFAAAGAFLMTLALSGSIPARRAALAHAASSAQAASAYGVGRSDMAWRGPHSGNGLACIPAAAIVVNITSRAMVAHAQAAPCGQSAGWAAAGHASTSGHAAGVSGSCSKQEPGPQLAASTALASRARLLPLHEWLPLAVAPHHCAFILSKPLPPLHRRTAPHVHASGTTDAGALPSSRRGSWQGAAFGSAKGEVAVLLALLAAVAVAVAVSRRCGEATNCRELRDAPDAPGQQCIAPTTSEHGAATAAASELQFDGPSASVAASDCAGAAGRCLDANADSDNESSDSGSSGSGSESPEAADSSGPGEDDDSISQPQPNAPAAAASVDAAAPTTGGARRSRRARSGSGGAAPRPRQGDATVVEQSQSQSSAGHGAPLASGDDGLGQQAAADAQAAAAASATPAGGSMGSVEVAGPAPSRGGTAHVASAAGSDSPGSGLKLPEQTGAAADADSERKPAAPSRRPRAGGAAATAIGAPGGALPFVFPLAAGAAGLALSPPALSAESALPVPQSSPSSTFATAPSIASMQSGMGMSQHLPAAPVPHSLAAAAAMNDALSWQPESAVAAGFGGPPFAAHSWAPQSSGAPSAISATSSELPPAFSGPSASFAAPPVAAAPAGTSFSSLASNGSSGGASSAAPTGQSASSLLAAAPAAPLAAVAVPTLQAPFAFAAPSFASSLQTSAAPAWPSSLAAGAAAVQFSSTVPAQAAASLAAPTASGSSQTLRLSAVPPMATTLSMPAGAPVSAPQPQAELGLKRSRPSDMAAAAYVAGAVAPASSALPILPPQPQAQAGSVASPFAATSSASSPLSFGQALASAALGVQLPAHAGHLRSSKSTTAPVSHAAIAHRHGDAAAASAASKAHAPVHPPLTPALRGKGAPAAPTGLVGLEATPARALARLSLSAMDAAARSEGVEPLSAALGASLALLQPDSKRPRGHAPIAAASGAGAASAMGASAGSATAAATSRTLPVAAAASQAAIGSAPAPASPPFPSLAPLALLAAGAADTLSSGSASLLLSQPAGLAGSRAAPLASLQASAAAAAARGSRAAGIAAASGGTPMDIAQDEFGPSTAGVLYSVPLSLSLPLQQSLPAFPPQTASAAGHTR